MPNKRIDADLENRRRFAMAVFKAGHPSRTSRLSLMNRSDKNEKAQ
ncbi:MAG: hypothetical protein KAU60_13465 [Desulfobacterales bacterium]|nr:hypothetical protein [Desulfobacterales bacterium]